MASGAHSLKAKTCIELLPMLQKAADEFGIDRIIEAAYESPIAKANRFYKTDKIARSGLRRFFKGSYLFSWSTMKAYSWALQHLYPYANSNPTLARIDAYYIQQTKSPRRLGLLGQPVAAPPPTSGNSVQVVLYKPETPQPDVDELGLDMLARHDWAGLAKLCIEQMRAAS